MDNNNESFRPEFLDFGQAIKALKRGKRVTRGGWCSNDVWLMLIESDEYTVSLRFPYDALKVKGIESSPWIGVKTADNEFVPWVAGQTDILAEDWIIL